jgi:hypothetical protein
MELSAALGGLGLLYDVFEIFAVSNNPAVRVFSDSIYVVRGAMGKINIKMNMDLWVLKDFYANRMDLTFTHVPRKHLQYWDHISKYASSDSKELKNHVDVVDFKQIASCERKWRERKD